MKTLKLEIPDPSRISLPDWIIESDLSLSEIGAIACWACVINDPEKLLSHERLRSNEMTAATVSLQIKKVFSVSMMGKRVSLSINLDPITPAGI